MQRLLSVVRRLSASPLAGYALGYAAAGALQKGVGFLVFMWLAHALGTSAYASFGLLYALQTALITIATAGIVESTIALLKSASGPEGRARMFATANSMFLLMFAGAAMLVVIIHDTLLETGTTYWVLVSVIVAGGLTAFFTVQSALIRLEERHGASIMLSAGAPLLGFLGGATGFLIGKSVDGFFAGMAAGLLTVCIPYAWSGIGKNLLSHDRAAVSALGATLLPYLVISALLWLSGYGNAYLVDLVFEDAEVASFIFAYTLSALMQLIATSLNQVWSPRFFRLSRELAADALERRNRLFTIGQGLALGLGGAILIAAAPWVLWIAGGNLIAYLPLRWEYFFLFAGYALSIPWWHTQNYYYLHGRGQELLWVSMAGSLVGLLAWVLCVLVFGVLGIYIGLMIQMLVRSAAAYLFARTVWKVRLAWEGMLIGLMLMLAGTLLPKPHP